MEELEDSTERLKETMEAAEEKKERWTMNVALSTAIIAVFAAIAGMLGNHHANEAVLDQIRSSDKWAYYQSKSIKEELYNNTTQILTAFNKPVPSDNVQTINRYEKEKKEIKEAAEQEEKNSEQHMREHIVFSRSVTIFQIAIALSAIAILTRKKLLWYVSLLLAAAGITFFVIGFFTV